VILKYEFGMMWREEVGTCFKTVNLTGKVIQMNQLDATMIY